MTTRADEAPDLDEEVAEVEAVEAELEGADHVAGPLGEEMPAEAENDPENGPVSLRTTCGRSGCGHTLEQHHPQGPRVEGDDRGRRDQCGADGCDCPGFEPVVSLAAPPAVEAAGSDPVECSGCHWRGTASELVCGDDVAEDTVGDAVAVLECPACHLPFEGLAVAFRDGEPEEQWHREVEVGEEPATFEAPPPDVEAVVDASDAARVHVRRSGWPDAPCGSFDQAAEVIAALLADEAACLQLEDLALQVMPEPGAEWVDVPRVCRGCGKTDDQVDGNERWWVRWDLCSVCQVSVQFDDDAGGGWDGEDEAFRDAAVADHALDQLAEHLDAGQLRAIRGALRREAVRAMEAAMPWRSSGRAWMLAAVVVLAFGLGLLGGVMAAGGPALDDLGPMDPEEIEAGRLAREILGRAARSAGMAGFQAGDAAGGLTRSLESVGAASGWDPAALELLTHRQVTTAHRLATRWGRAAGLVRGWGAPDVSCRDWHGPGEISEDRRLCFLLWTGDAGELEHPGEALLCPAWEVPGASCEVLGDVLPDAAEGDR